MDKTMSSAWNYIWKTIHIIGKTFNPQDENAKESFVWFFRCLVDLIPDTQASKTLSSSMAFEWTYKLHSYVNLIKKRQGQLSDDITLEQAHKKYSMITKPDWANPMWFLIHYFAANFPEKISQQQAVSYKTFIACMRYLLPCTECRGHMNNYITNNDIDPYLGTRNDLFFWGFTFHNAVNARLKKQIIGLDVAFAMYIRTDSVYTLIDY